MCISMHVHMSHVQIGSPTNAPQSIQSSSAQRWIHHEEVNHPVWCVFEISVMISWLLYLCCLAMYIYIDIYLLVCIGPTLSHCDPVMICMLVNSNEYVRTYTAGGVCNYIGRLPNSRSRQPSACGSRGRVRAMGRHSLRPPQLPAAAVDAYVSVALAIGLD